MTRNWTLYHVRGKHQTDKMSEDLDGIVPKARTTKKDKMRSDRDEKVVKTQRRQKSKW